MTRAVVDWRGQIVTMADRAYLTEAMPLCVIWGEDDRVIPATHASIAAELAPGARVEVISNAGHFPHKDHPERFVRIVNDFVRKTQPATYSRARFRTLLRNGRRTRGSYGAARRDRERHADPLRSRWSSRDRLDPSEGDQASPPSCLTPRTAVGSVMR